MAEHSEQWNIDPMVNHFFKEIPYAPVVIPEYAKYTDFILGMKHVKYINYVLMYYKKHTSEGLIIYKLIFAAE